MTDSVCKTLPAAARHNRMKRPLGASGGFTMVELVVALAVLGVLSFLLIQQFSLVGDKAMGTTARMDCRSLLSALAADRAYKLAAGDTRLTQPEVNTALGLDDNGVDASGSKTVLVGRHDPKLGVDLDPSFVTYIYQRNDTTLTAIIDLNSNAVLWHVAGVTDSRRINALCDGLKIGAGDISTPSPPPP